MTQMFFNWLMDKKEQATAMCNDMSVYEVNHAKCKKPDSKSVMPYAFNCKTFWKRQNYRDTNQISGCPGLRLSPQD